ncbi:ATPase P [Salegentibacter salinarum]|uniref:ATPase P n=1 Tax=Salegentibacter salinarum TaxID=447422 RepID=A0A2N0U273_9FLAO|nr:cation-transporting P-type ATPase [Salegentibacter salinarum]PKD21094.1 ATPase P [Salegentibacter salinarum]SKB75831.1 Ca2+-transporting ATPase [Salegentibacter salinarum]
MISEKELSDLRSEAYRLSSKEVVEKLKSDADNGLDKDKIKDRQEKFGKNQLQEKSGKSILSIILSQLNNPVIYLLTAAALIAFLFGDIPEAIVILVVLIVNTIIGFWMEYQAQKSMEAIKKMDKTEITVIRYGKETELDAEEIVPGDILKIDAGDLIPADARLLEANELQIDEAALTGESVPVNKSTEAIDTEKQVADRNNTIYKGTAVTAGTGKAVVFATAMHTEVGNISAMVQEQDKEETPLTTKLNQLTKNLIWVILAMAAAFFLFGWLTDKDLYQLVQTSIAWTIAAIPEGLPIVASIALARGMYRLSKQNVLVKKLSAVETLGETTVIFTDKTGTLTKNKLTVKNFSFPQKDDLKVNWKNEKPEVQDQENSNFQEIFKISVLANDANLEDEGKGNGDPLEIALLKFTKHLDEELYTENKKKERILHKPFDSDTMTMGVAFKSENGQIYVAAKGSSNAILDKSTHILENDEEKDFSKEQKEKWQQKNDELSEDGLRVLAFGFRKTENKPEDEDNFIEKLCFVGLIGFIDPPREEIASSIETCKKAGIKILMVTGDHPGTAKNVGKTVHLFSEDEENNDVTVHGKNLNDKDIQYEEIKDSYVFSRVAPGQKLQLIEIYKENGEIVAMTGDGVNDAPALKKADIGIAMGKRGTQVAQEVADVVLKDDSFDSIINAVAQGRIIFGNIRRFVVYQLSYHLSEILIIAIMSFSLFTLPILPLQLLFLNLLSDVFPALALGVGEGDKKVLDYPPKDPKEPVLKKKNWRQIISYGLIITASISGAYLYSHFILQQSESINNNIAFFSLAFAQFLHVFNLRDGDENMFNNQVTRNKFIWMALLLCITLVLIAYFVPVFADVLSFEKLSLQSWILIGISSIVPLIIIQLIKEIKKDF